MSEMPAERTFTSLPEQLNIGKMEQTMALGVAQWGSKQPEEKEEITRCGVESLIKAIQFFKIW